MKFFTFITLLVFYSLSYAQEYEADTALTLMGKGFILKAIADNENTAKNAVFLGVKEIQRIEALISSYQSTSETSLINRNAGIKETQVTSETFGLIVRSKKISALTKGAFDISFSPLYKVWNFKSGLKAFPSEDSVLKYKKLVDYSKIKTNTELKSVFLAEKGMYISFGSIGKGYAANKAKQIMKKAGANSGFVNASGDILFWGKPLNSENWSVGITNPKLKGQYLGWINVNNIAVVTSGDYEQFIEIDGKRYSHIIDPRTGYPVENVTSVTIICPDAELADALATSVSVLGPEEGIKLVNRLKNVECLMIMLDGSYFQSKNLQLINK